MKFILAVLVVAFTVGFASPSFADDAQEKYEAERQEFIKEWLESENEQIAAEAEAEAETQAELVAEVESIMSKLKTIRERIYAIPVDPENHCEIAKGLLAKQVSILFMGIKF